MLIMAKNLSDEAFNASTESEALKHLMLLRFIASSLLVPSFDMSANWVFFFFSPAGQEEHSSKWSHRWDQNDNMKEELDLIRLQFFCYKSHSS
jgi:hypothetical protein